MYTARTIWIAETAVSFGLIALIANRLSAEEAQGFLVAELAAFAVSFLLAMLWGRPGKVLALGAGLGFAAATVLAIGGSSSCSEGDIICFSAGDLFALGLLIVGALYPGWAFGTGLGTLARRARS